jgi:hypothetical protein
LLLLQLGQVTLLLLLLQERPGLTLQAFPSSPHLQPLLPPLLLLLPGHWHLMGCLPAQQQQQLCRWLPLHAAASPLLLPALPPLHLHLPAHSTPPHSLPPAGPSSHACTAQEACRQQQRRQQQQPQLLKG